MVTKIFVGNLSFQMSDIELEDLFKEYGEVASAKVIVDRRTGRSRGFGFVEMNSEEQAQQAIEALNGAEVKGRPINASFARKQGFEDRDNGGGGSRDFGGGGYQKKRSYNDNY
ncbi:MAG: RNA-binding protein [Candidatus Melainabacteria bacterium]|nr:RNA-binding protein [Candidatus Melainabacteria bacterium]